MLIDIDFLNIPLYIYFWSDIFHKRLWRDYTISTSANYFRQWSRTFSNKEGYVVKLMFTRNAISTMIGSAFLYLNANSFTNGSLAFSINAASWTNEWVLRFFLLFIHLSLLSCNFFVLKQEYYYFFFWMSSFKIYVHYVF